MYPLNIISSNPACIGTKSIASNSTKNQSGLNPSYLSAIGILFAFDINNSVDRAIE